MTVTIPTSEAQYGYVVGRVIRALGDSADPDDKPDAVAATGKVTFTPKATLGRTTDYSAFIVREKIDAPLDAQGNLVRYEGATPAGIALTVGAYKVEFALASGSIPSFDIEVTAAHTQASPLDLVTAAPYVPPSGVTVQTMLVPADAVVGQVLAWSASGLDWVDMAAAAGAVSSVAGRTGAVVLSSADLTDAASLATDAELTSGLAGKANSSHTHAPADITGTAVITTDPRLSDARTPTDSSVTNAKVAAGAGINLDKTTDSATRLAMTSAERTKLTGVATGATANATDAQLRSRSTHTGTQTAASISDLTEVVQDIVGALIVAGTNTTVSYDDAAGTFTINSTAGGGGTDPEVVRDTIGGALVAGSGIQITVNDAADTITIASTAVLPTRQVIAGTGLTGGGDLSADRTLTVAYGTTAGSAAQGNDSRIVNAVPNTRTVNGKALSANITLTAADVGASTFSGAYADLSGKPTLGTAAATAATDYATAAQGTKADTALQTATAQPINAQTGTTYTLQASDAGKLVTLTNAAAITLTVPGSVFAAGQRVDIGRRGAGVVTVVAGSGMTVNPPPGGSLVMQGQYAYASLVFISATEADLVGLVPAGSTAVNMQYGTWGAASDGVGSTSQSSRFASYWRDGVCIIHIDFSRVSGDYLNAVGQVHTSTPVPPGIQEVQVGEYYVWMDPNSSNYDIFTDAPVGTRIIANLVYLY